MSLAKQLSQWQAAGLIDAKTRERILEFEAKRGRPRLAYGLAGLGAVSIGIGVISIVAANWDGIGPYVKLAVDVSLNVALAVGMYHALRREASLLAEVLGVVYYLGCLASLALVGQIYQLRSPAWQLLAVWSVLTLPLVLLLRSYLAGLVWSAGFCTSYVMTVAELFHGFEESGHFDDLQVGLLSAWPLLTMLLARVPWRRELRSRFVGAVDSSAWASVVLAGALLPLAFYANIREHETFDLGLLLCAGTALGLHFCQERWLGEAPRRARRSVSLLLLATWLAFALPFSFAHRDLDLVGALLQVGYLGLLATTSLQFGWTRTFHTLTGLIALRILVVYFEVFGSMLSTGLGLVSGGVLTLLLAWAWKRKSPELAARLEVGKEARHGS